MLLLTISALVLLVITSSSRATSLGGARQYVGSPQRLATTLQDEQRPYLDDECNKLSGGPESEIGRLVRLLKCDIKPLYEHYKCVYGGDAGKSIGLRDQVGLELENMSTRVREFADEASVVLGSVDFCNSDIVQRIHQLGTKAAGSTLLTEAFNLIAIEYHSSCLRESLSSLPRIPSLVREVVDIYIGGADESIHKPKMVLNDYEDQKFDVDAAIKRSGALEDVVGLTLAIGTNEKVARDFRKQCKDLVLQMDTHWGVMSTMNRLLANEKNNIQWLNNAILGTLTPTKFADICSQLSTRSP